MTSIEVCGRGLWTKKADSVEREQEQALAGASKDGREEGGLEEMAPWE